MKDNGNIRNMTDVANWNPGPGGVDSDSKKAKLLSTEAQDNPENFSAMNEQKRWTNPPAKKSGPYGKRGQMF
jgi:hypothetical protein